MEALATTNVARAFVFSSISCLVSFWLSILSIICMANFSINSSTFSTSFHLQLRHHFLSAIINYTFLTSTSPLVQHFLIPHTLSTRYLRHRRVVVSQQCHRIASFLRLALTKISSTKYMGIKKTLY